VSPVADAERVFTTDAEYAEFGVFLTTIFYSASSARLRGELSELCSHRSQRTRRLYSKFAQAVKNLIHKYRSES
jgi:hypothetical protein